MRMTLTITAGSAGRVRRRFKRGGQQTVARKHSQRFTEDLVIGETAAAVIVIVHAWQIVVDKAVGMDHLKRAGKGNGALPISAADAAEFQRQDRTDAFPPASRL